MVTPDAKRDAVAHACAVHGVSQRRACEALDVDRSSARYRSNRAPDLELREAMKAVATERRRFGYRRIHVMLERQGIVMNIKKLRRLYSEEKLRGSQARWPQTSFGHQAADTGARPSEPTLEPRLRQ